MIRLDSHLLDQVAAETRSERAVPNSTGSTRKSHGPKSTCAGQPIAYVDHAPPCNRLILPTPGGGALKCLSVLSCRNRRAAEKACSTMKAHPIALVAFSLIASQAVAQAPADAARGAKLAGSVCAECHAVRAGQSRSPDPMAPGFDNVAAWPGMTDRALRVWLQTSHPTMPNFILKRRDRDDVVAYILSLRTGHSAL